jgi:hypothetical protein
MSLIRLQLLLSSILLAGAACVHVQAQSLPTAPTTTTGERKTAVVLVNFTDDATQLMTPAQAETMVFGNVSDFFWEASYGKTFVSGQTFGWTTAPVTSANCRWSELVAQGDRAMAAAGADPASFQHFVYVFPKATGCPAGASNQTGTNGEKRVFLNGPANANANTVAHEMGHSFGLLHSDELDCDRTPLGDTCSVLGYADVADTMGGNGHFNAYWKERLGWLGTVGAPGITSVTASGRYTIATYETTGSASKALKIFKSTDPVNGRSTWYYVERRQAIGFDAQIANRGGNLTNGVLIHIGTPTGAGGTSQLLDMTPNSTATGDPLDAALEVGRTFSDPTSGVSITLVSADANSAVLDVVVPASTPQPPPPSATLTESVGTDATQYARGATVRMSALVKRDGVVASGATVAFSVTQPNGSKTVVNAVSGTDGYARATYKSGKTKSAVGNYGVRADATLSGGSATATTAFSVY